MGGLFAADETAGESEEGWAALGFDPDGFRRRPAVSAFIVSAASRSASVSRAEMAAMRLALGPGLGMLAQAAPAAPATDEDADLLARELLFFYAYGALHSPAWRSRFASDLRKGLPRLPLPASADELRRMAALGHRLALLHLFGASGVWLGAGAPPSAPASMRLVLDGSAVPHAPGGVEPDFASLPAAACRVDKMRRPAKGRADALLVTDRLSIEGMPPEVQAYVVNGKSAVDWVAERVALSQDKATGIVNDPNLWASEHSDPAFAPRLAWRVAVISAATTAAIAEAFPEADGGSDGATDE